MAEHNLAGILGNATLSNKEKLVKLRQLQKGAKDLGLGITSRVDLAIHELHPPQNNLIDKTLRFGIILLTIINGLFHKL